MTWREFSIYVIAWERNGIIRLVETREIVYSIYNSQPKDHSFRMPSKEKLWPLPFDEKQPEVKPPTKEEIERMMELLTTPKNA